MTALYPFWPNKSSFDSLRHNERRELLFGQKGYNAVPWQPKQFFENFPIRHQKKYRRLTSTYDQTETGNICIYTFNKILNMAVPKREISLLLILISVEFLRSLSYGRSFDIAYKMSIKTRSAFCAYAYQVILASNSNNNKTNHSLERSETCANIQTRQSIEAITGPEFVHLLDSGGNEFLDFFRVFYTVICIPMILIIITIMTYFLIGYPSIVAILGLLFTIPLQIILLKSSLAYKEKIIIIEAQRCNFIGEIFRSMRLVKSLCWEEKILKICDDLCQFERQSYVKKTRVFCAFSTLSLLSTIIITAIAIPLHLSDLAKKNIVQISIIEIFVSINLWSMISQLLRLMPIGIKAILDLKLTCSKFLEIFRGDPDLYLKDAENGFREKSQKKKIRVPQNPEKENLSMEQSSLVHKNHNSNPVLSMNNASFSFSDSNSCFLNNLTIQIEPCQLIGICGKSSSGKSSFLKSIIGILEQKHGFYQKRGNLAYYSQKPWIAFGTVKENIEIAAEKSSNSIYQEIIQNCALEPDLKQLKHGENTMLGENGAALSGGQQARISLARALYSDRDIFLLDDPLAAVDRMVAKKLFDEAINDFLIKKHRKTVLLATHQIDYLGKCHKVLVLDEGRIKEFDTPAKLLADVTSLFSQYYSNFIESQNKTKDHREKTDNYDENHSLEESQRIPAISMTYESAVDQSIATTGHEKALFSSNGEENNLMNSMEKLKSWPKSSYSYAALKFYLKHWGGFKAIFLLLAYYFVACVVSYGCFLWITIFIMASNPQNTPVPEIANWLHNNHHFPNLTISTTGGSTLNCTAVKNLKIVFAAI